MRRALDIGTPGEFVQHDQSSAPKTHGDTIVSDFRTALPPKACVCACPVDEFQAGSQPASLIPLLGHVLIPHGRIRRRARTCVSDGRVPRFDRTISQRDDSSAVAPPNQARIEPDLPHPVARSVPAR